MNKDLIILPTTVFNRPYRAIAGRVVVAPTALPKGSKLKLYLSNGKTKSIAFQSEITTSLKAWDNNLHGYTYTGDLITQEDLKFQPIISNLPYNQAMSYLLKAA